MKTSKIFTLFLISGLITCGGITAIIACGAFEDYDTGEYSVFAPEIIHQPENEPFFLSYHYYYSSPEVYNDSYSLTELNTNDWQQYFENKVSKKEIEWLVYETKPEDLLLIKNAISLRNNRKENYNREIIRELGKKINYEEIISYLNSAKLAEKHFDITFDSWSPVEYNFAFLDSFQKHCREKFKITNDDFLKNRYGFQITRCLSIIDHDQCIRFFDDEFKPSPKQGNIYYRSLGHKARSLYHTGRYAEANAIYAKLFHQFPPLNFVAKQSFHPQEESDWKETLKLLTSKEEKIAAWELMGLYPDPLRALKEIYAINPKSKPLKLLLARCVNISELKLLKNPIKNWDNFYSQEYATTTNINDDNIYNGSEFGMIAQNELASFLEKVIKENNTTDINLWKLAYAHVSILNNHLDNAKNILYALPDRISDTSLQQQAIILKGILAATLPDSITNETEIKIYNHVKNIQGISNTTSRSSNAIRYIFSRMSYRYGLQKNIVKKELAYPMGFTYYTSSAKTKKMISFLNKKELNKWEKLLLSQYSIAQQNLNEILQMNYMYEYNFKAAAAIQQNDTNKYYLTTNPFNNRIKDCLECEEKNNQAKLYTKNTFCSKMNVIKEKAENSRNAEERAQNYFLYATALYNLTWYGHARGLRSTSDLWVSYAYITYGPSEYLRRTNYFDCSQALLYYNKAFDLSKNKEFRAKCIWMMAKCEHNNRITTESLKEGDAFKAGKYFSLFKNYKETSYYKEVINECGYFRTYLSSQK